MKSPLFVSILIAGAAVSLGGCSSKTDAANTPAASAGAPTSTGARAAANLTPGKSTVADLKMYVGNNLSVSKGTGDEAVYRYSETRPGPVKTQKVIIVWSKTEPSTITTTHHYRFVKGLFAEYWASEATGL